VSAAFFCWEATLNNIRILSCFAGFTVSVSLFANIPPEHKPVPPATLDPGETETILRVVDPDGTRIANAHITVQDELGRTVASGNTNQSGLFRLPSLVGASYTFTVSLSGTLLAEFQSFVPASPAQSTEIEVALKDPCYIDGHLTCDEFAKAPFFVDGFQKDSLMVIGPYPIPEKPKLQSSFFKRLLARFHHRQNGK